MKPYAQVAMSSLGRLFQPRQTAPSAIAKPSNKDIHPLSTEEAEKLLEEIRQAHRDWVRIQHQFDGATDPDIIDQLIFSMHTVEKRYAYLLRLARRQGVKVLATGVQLSS